MVFNIFFKLLDKLYKASSEKFFSLFKQKKNKVPSFDL